MNMIDGVYNLLGGDQPAALILALGPFVARAPEEISVIELQRHIIPATIAAVRVEDSIRSVELANRKRKPTDQYHWDS